MAELQHGLTYPRRGRLQHCNMVGMVHGIAYCSAEHIADPTYPRRGRLWPIVLQNTIPSWPTHKGAGCNIPKVGQVARIVPRGTWGGWGPEWVAIWCSQRGKSWVVCGLQYRSFLGLGHHIRSVRGMEVGEVR